MPGVVHGGVARRRRNRRIDPYGNPHIFPSEFSSVRERELDSMLNLH